MARVLRMPGVAANATEAVLAEWLVAEATDFAAADAIATVETDKAAVDIEADSAGRMLKTLVLPGAQVEVGDPIAVLGAPGEKVDDLDALLASLGVVAATEVVVPQCRTVPSDPESAAPLAEAIERPVPSLPRSVANRRAFASPLARKIARDNGLTIEEIEGTGPRGRILRRDVDAAVVHRREPRASKPPVQLRPAGRAGSVSDVTDPAPAPRPGVAEAVGYEEIPHSRVRRATARRLTDSKQQTPHFYMRATVRVEALLALRAELNEEAATRVSVNDLVVKAVAGAHRRVPEMNVTWAADAVRRYRSVDIAVAVATDRGLMTPVLRDVGSLTTTAVATSVRELANRARDGKLRPDDLEGGTISVTNLGMFGVEEFAAIINPPHAAILAVGAVRDEPVVEDDAIVPGRVMTLTLSVDHRPVDGVIAARWLAVLSNLLQHPVRILG